MGDFAKYLAPQMPWSLTIYFPSSSGPISGATPAAGALLTQAAGGRGLWLKSNLTGLDGSRRSVGARNGPPVRSGSDREKAAGRVGHSPRGLQSCDA